MEKFRYYVVFSHVRPDGLRNGCTEMDCEGPMEDKKERLRTVAHITGLGFTHVIILNWKRID